jgi:DNA-binding GntR family transcriptional regulator
MEQAMRDRQRTTPRRHGERTRTIPEQIADHVGNAIINGEYPDGERIREQELATLYNVSRGPVREAIRVLEQRGLVNFFPRRGAYVVGVTLDTIVELFNTRAVLMGLAARDLARRRNAQPLADLQAGIAQLRELAESRSTAERFTRASARIGGLVIANCGNLYLARLLRHQVDYTLWGFIWRDRPLDFFTPSRQQSVVREWQALAAAIAAGKDQDAERAQRRVFFNSRDAAIATLQKTRSAKIDRAQLIKD